MSSRTASSPVGSLFLGRRGRRDMPPPNELTRFPNGEYVLPVIEASAAPSNAAVAPPATPATAAPRPPPAAIVVTAPTPAAAPADPAVNAVAASACPT